MTRSFHSVALCHSGAVTPRRPPFAIGRTPSCGEVVLGQWESLPDDASMPDAAFDTGAEFVRCSRPGSRLLRVMVRPRGESAFASRQAVARGSSRPRQKDRVELVSHARSPRRDARRRTPDRGLRALDAVDRLLARLTLAAPRPRPDRTCQEPSTPSSVRTDRSDRVVLGHGDTVEEGAAHRTARRRHPTRRRAVIGAEAHHGKPDLEQLGGIPVQPPDDDSGEAGRVRLERDEVADARLVGSPAVVDDEHGSRRRVVDHLEEHVDGAEVGDRTGGPGEVPPGRSAVGGMPDAIAHRESESKGRRRPRRRLREWTWSHCLRRRSLTSLA